MTAGRVATVVFDVGAAAAIVASFVVATSRPGQPVSDTACQTADTEAAAQGVPMRSCRILRTNGPTAVLRQVGTDGTVWLTTVVRSDWRIVSVK